MEYRESQNASEESIVDMDIVFVTGELEQRKERARQLVNSTLAPMESAIDIVAVKIGHDMDHPLATFDYHCTILLKFKGGARIRAEARDCDDILAVYRALAKIIDQIPLRDVRAANDLVGRIE